MIIVKVNVHIGYVSDVMDYMIYIWKLVPTVHHVAFVAYKAMMVKIVRKNVRSVALLDPN